MKKTIIVLAIIISIIVLAFFLIKVAGQSILPQLFGTDNLQNQHTTEIKDNKLLNKKMPFFDLSDIDGKRIKSSSFLDKPLIVAFWSTWNVEGANQLKILDGYVSSQDKNNSLISIVSIDSQEESNIVKLFMKRGGYEVPVALDTSGSVTENYNIKSLPTIFFIDRDGIIRDIYIGVVNKTTLDTKVEQLLK